MFKKTKNIRGLICGIIGCLCYGSGDWLMMYGDPSYSGKLAVEEYYPFLNCVFCTSANEYKAEWEKVNNG